MNIKSLIRALTTLKLINKQDQLVPVKLDRNIFSIKNKYQQRRISNRLF